MRRDAPPKLRFLLVWLFPLALWLLATGFYGFDLGKYSDDWAVSLRTPETDAYSWPASPFIRWAYFWRPVHLLVVYGLATAFWHHDWVNHLISALAHLGVGLLMYRLLRLLGIAAAPAMCALCLFLVAPWAVEAVLWPAALGSVVAMGVFFFTAMMCVKWWRQERPIAPATRAWRCLSLAALGFVTACWHEQPAACVIALPLLYVASGAHTRRPGSLRRAGLGMLSCAAGVGAYAALFLATVPTERRGGARTRTIFGALGERLARLCEMTWNLTFGPRARDSTIDALHIGNHAIREAWGPLGVVAIVLLAGLGGLWAIAILRRDRAVSPEIREGGDGISRFWIAAFGLCAGAASMLPIAAVAAQPLWGRHLYGLTAGAAFALAAGLDAIFSTRTMWFRKGARLTAGVAVVSISVAGALCWVGWQTEFRRRFDADQEQMARLRALVPDPPRGAVFVPIEIADGRPAGLRPFDPGISGALANPWSCWAYVQCGYGRSDISATHLHPGVRAPLKVSDGRLVYSRGVCDQWGRTDASRHSIALDEVVPFTIDGSGAVHVLTVDEAIKSVSARQAGSQ